jgi:hypothetical protein
MLPGAYLGEEMQNTILQQNSEPLTLYSRIHFKFMSSHIACEFKESAFILPY